MSVKDVIKNSVYESLGGGTTMSAKTVVLILLIACLMGVYIFLVYKLSSKTAFYSKDLNLTIAGMPVIVAAIMIAMQSNLLVSLGMVGALSIVRFRNALKNPQDIDYTSLYDLIRSRCRYYKEKARSTKNSETELIIEIRTKEKDLLLQALNKTGYFTQVNCISHDGELRI